MRACLLLLGLLYATSRLYHLALLPLFVDEAIHIDWARRLLVEGRLLRILDDGKLLQVLAMTPSVPWVAEPAWWGRLTTVAVGGLGLWVSWRLGASLFGERVGLLAAALYVVCPFTLFYDRMALSDGFLSVFAALTLLASLRFLAAPTRGAAVLLGLAMAASVLSKVPGLITVGFAPLVLLVLGRPRQSWLGRLAVSYAITGALIAFPVWHFFSRTGQLGMKATAADDPSRLGTIAYNAGLAFGWLRLYWTGPVLLLGVAVALVSLVRWQRRELVLLVAAATPLGSFIAVADAWFPRYVLFATIPFLVLTARGLGAVDEHVLRRLSGPPAGRLAARLLLGAVVAWPALHLDAALLSDPARASLPREERFQYVEGWPSGYAWKEAAAFLEGQARRSGSGIRILVDRADHRTAIRVLRAYLMNDPRIEIVPVDMREGRTQSLVGVWLTERPAYVLRSGARPEKLKELPETGTYELDLVRRFHKPGGLLVGELFLAREVRAVPGSETEALGGDAVENRAGQEGGPGDPR